MSYPYGYGLSRKEWWIWFWIKASVIMIFVGYIWWRYTCYMAYSEYTGETANTGFLNGVFRFLGLGD